MSGRSGRLSGERGASSAPQTFTELPLTVQKTAAGEFYRRTQKPPVESVEVSGQAAYPTQKRDKLHTILHIIGIALALVILLLISTRAHAQGSVNQNTYDSQGQLKVVCSGCAAASSVTINDPSVTTQKAAVSAAGNIAVECKVGCAGGATTPADTFANPSTAGLSFDFLALWNGTTWDRWKGDATNGAFVNVKTSVLPTGAAADSSLTTIDTDLKANIVLAAGTHVIGHVINDTGSTTGVTGNVATTAADASNVTLGAKADAKSTATDTTAITIMQVLKEISAMAQAPAALPANQSVNVAQVNGQTTTTTDNGTQAVAPIVTTSSTAATSACNILSAASTNATSCKGSAGNFYGYEIYNTTTTIYYLRLYNTASAPTCSSATGFIRTIPIQPAGASGGAGGSISNQVFPVNYGTGIGYCITGGSSSTDNTNAATGIFGEIRYK